MQEEKKATAPKSPTHVDTKTSGGKRERKLGALAGRVKIASGFDETPSELIELFEGESASEARKPDA